MRKQSLSIISAFMISAVLLTGCGDTAPVLDNATPETTEASEAAASETEVSDKIPEETADTATAEVSDDTDNALDTNMETATEEENNETPTEPEQPEETEETGYVKPEGVVNAYENQDKMPKPTDYGVSIKTMEDLPNADIYGWDFEKHPIWYGYTDKNFQVVYDPTTDLCYYANMMMPTGDLFGRPDYESITLYNYIKEKGYGTALEVTYEEAVELFGKPDMSTMSTSDWGSKNYEANKVNK